MNTKISPILAAILVTLTACGGTSGSEPATARQGNVIISNPGNNPVGFSDDPITVEPIAVTEPDPVVPAPAPVQQPVQQPAPTVVIQDPPPSIEPVLAEPVQSQPIPAEPEPVEPEPVVAEVPAIQEAEVAEGECVVPTAGTTIVSQTTPVRPSDNPSFYPAMGPQCVVPTNQFNGSGAHLRRFPAV